MYKKTTALKDSNGLISPCTSLGIRTLPLSCTWLWHLAYPRTEAEAILSGRQLRGAPSRVHGGVLCGCCRWEHGRQFVNRSQGGGKVHRAGSIHTCRFVTENVSYRILLGDTKGLRVEPAEVRWRLHCLPYGHTHLQ